MERVGPNVNGSRTRSEEYGMRFASGKMEFTYGMAACMVLGVGLADCGGGNSASLTTTRSLKAGAGSGDIVVSTAFFANPSLIEN